MKKRGKAKKKKGQTIEKNEKTSHINHEKLEEALILQKVVQSIVWYDKRKKKKENDQILIFRVPRVVVQSCRLLIFREDRLLV